jgi:glutaredoxin
MNAEAAQIEAYWMPGCSSCLRMKEFLEKSGVDFVAINVDDRPDIKDKLMAQGLYLPATCVGDRCVNGLDLSAVAELVGVPYEPRAMMTPAELVERYDLNIAAGLGLIEQMTPEVVSFKLEGRDREILGVAYQVAMVGRSFLEVYSDDKHNTAYYTKPDDITDRDTVLALGEETRAMMRKWWDEEGQYDSLDRVTQTYWGFPTLHEVLEREVWHTTQHARQVEYALQRCGIEPAQPLGPANLDGLPLPERVHA